MPDYFELDLGLLCWFWDVFRLEILLNLSTLGADVTSSMCTSLVTGNTPVALNTVQQSAQIELLDTRLDDCQLLIMEFLQGLKLSL